MNNLSLDDFFAAFKSLRARGTAHFDNSSGCCGSQKNTGCGSSRPSGCYDCDDDDIQINDSCCKNDRFDDCDNYWKPSWNDGGCCKDEKPAWRPQRPSHGGCGSSDDGCCNDEPIYRPQRPSVGGGCGSNNDGCCNDEPVYRPQRPVRPQRPSRPQMPSIDYDYKHTNINNGTIDGPGNDIYDGEGNDIYAMGNKGIIDTEGNDIYAKNYSVNTFNTTNNYYRQNIVNPEDPVDPEDPEDPEDPSDPVTVDLLPLRNLLNVIECASGDRDGVLSDIEMNAAMINPSKADLDGDVTNISSEEMAIFNKIKQINEDKTLISNVLKGDYSDISDLTMQELIELSDKIKELTERK